MRAVQRLVMMLVILCAAGATAWAQSDIRANHWSRGTTLNGFAGLATDATDTGPVLGGAVGWDLTPRLAIEGSGSWVEFGDGANAFGGAIKLRARVAGRRTVDPFVVGGVGLYRASFGSREGRMPTFYGRRMGAHTYGNGLGIAFTDPAVVGGAGVNIYLNRQFAVRPDVEAMVVLRHRRSLVVTSIALHGVYHFENRPVTPGRRR